MSTITSDEVRRMARYAARKRGRGIHHDEAESAAYEGMAVALQRHTQGLNDAQGQGNDRKTYMLQYALWYAGNQRRLWDHRQRRAPVYLDHTYESGGTSGTPVSWADLHPEVTSTRDADPFDPEGVSPEQRRLLRERLDRLSDDQRRLVWQYYAEEVPPEVLAEERGVSVEVLQASLGGIMRKLRADYSWKERARELIDQGLSDGAVARQIGTSASSVLRYRTQELRRESPYVVRLRERQAATVPSEIEARKAQWRAERAEILDMAAQGMTYADIARHLGVSASAVKKRVQRARHQDGNQGSG